MMHDIKVINKRVITRDNVEHNRVTISERQCEKDVRHAKQPHMQT